MPVFFASFRFEHPPARYGRFEIVAEANSIHRAERQFRKKISACFYAQAPEERPVEIYLLDIIELDHFSDAVLMNFSSVREDSETDDPDSRQAQEEAEGIYRLSQAKRSEIRSGSVFFSGLPLREKNAQHWSVSMPQEPERFMLID